MGIPNAFAAATTATGQQLDDNFTFVGALGVIPCTITGTNSLTLTPTSKAVAFSAYQQGMTFSGVIANDNTGAVTANAGVGALSVYQDTSAGPAALAGAELQAGNELVLVYDAALNSSAGGFHIANLLSSGGGGGAVTSFNTRTGAVTLSTADVNTVMTGATAVTVGPSTPGTINNMTVGVSGSAVSNAKTGAFAGQALGISPVGNPTGGGGGGNPLTTFTSLSVTDTTAKASNREFLFNIGLTSNLGSGVSNGNGDKVAEYIGATGSAGTGDLWCANWVLTAGAGSGTYSATMLEPDLVNANPNCSMVGINMAGATSGGATITAAFQILEANAGAFANGIVVGNVAGGAIASTGSALVDTGTNNSTVVTATGIHKAVMQSVGGVLTDCFVVNSTAVTNSILRCPNASFTYGIDFNTSVAGQAAIRMGNNQNVNWRNASNSADILGMHVDGSNNMQIGDAGIAGIFLGTQNNGAVAPFLDNQIFLGLNAVAWLGTYSHAYTTVSDPRIKHAIESLPSVVGLFRSVTPISYVLNSDETETRRWGFNAEEVKSAFDEAGFNAHAAHTDGTSDLLGVNLMPMLAAAWQMNAELLAMVESLQARVAALEERA